MEYVVLKNYWSMMSSYFPDKVNKRVLEILDKADKRNQYKYIIRMVRKWVRLQELKLLDQVYLGAIGVTEAISGKVAIDLFSRLCKWTLQDCDWSDDPRFEDPRYDFD